MLHTYSPTPAQKAQHEAHKARIARMGGYAKQEQPSLTVVPKEKPVPVTRRGPLNRTWADARYYLPGPIRKIVVEVARKHDLSPSDIVSDSRVGPIVAARQEAMYRAFHEAGKTKKSIGRILGRDHSTVLFGIRAHESRMKRGAQNG